MKRLLSILLLLCLMIQVSSSISVLTYYQFNKQFIVDYFCVNKSRPTLQCEGKCFLKKQLKKNEESRQRSSEQNESLAFHLFVPDEAYKLPAYEISIAKPIPFYLESRITAVSSPTFHPPKV